jgi:hypothetical protein
MLVELMIMQTFGFMGKSYVCEDQQSKVHNIKQDIREKRMEM